MHADMPACINDTHQIPLHTRFYKLYYDAVYGFIRVLFFIDWQGIRSFHHGVYTGEHPHDYL